MASEPKDYTIFILMIMTSNTEATENKVDTTRHTPTQDLPSRLVQWMHFQVNTDAYAYKYDKERINLPPPLTQIEMEIQ